MTQKRPGRSPLRSSTAPITRAVGEGDAGRAVPRLHEGRVELVERPAGRVHRRVVLPRLRDHHQHRVRQGAAAQVQQLEHLVEGRGVADARRCRSGTAGQVAGDQVAGQLRLARPHPVPVAAHGVDLAVVRDVAVGVRQRPRRERVRREPRVHQGERAREALVGQVGEERLELAGGEHPLVDAGCAPTARRSRRRGLVLGALAQPRTPAAPGRCPTHAAPRPGRRTAGGTPA